MNRVTHPRTLAGAFLLALLAFQAQAADQTLTWQACLTLAQTQNPDYLAAQAELAQAEQDVTVAYAGLYPQLSLGASASKSSSQDTLTDPAKSSASLSFKQLLFDGFQTSAQAQAAKLELQKANTTFQTTAASLRYSLRQAYIDVIKTEQLVAVTQSIETQRLQNLNLVKLRYSGGREHIGSLKSAEANLAQARFEVDQAKRSRVLAQQQMAQLLGLPLDQTFVIAEQLTDLNELVADPDWASLVKACPQYRTTEFSRDIAKETLTQARSDYYPSLNLNASTGVNSEDWIPDHAEWSASLSLNFNLFDGGSRGAKLRKSQLALDKAELDLHSNYESLWLSLASQWKTFKDAEENVNVRQKYLDATMARSKIANAQYSNGLVSFEDWSSIEDTLVSARKSILTAQADYTLAFAKWQQLTGVDFSHE